MLKFIFLLIHFFSTALASAASPQPTSFRLKRKRAHARVKRPAIVAMSKRHTRKDIKGIVIIYLLGVDVEGI